MNTFYAAMSNSEHESGGGDAQARRRISQSTKTNLELFWAMPEPAANGFIIHYAYLPEPLEF